MLGAKCAYFGSVVSSARRVRTLPWPRHWVSQWVLATKSSSPRAAPFSTAMESFELQIDCEDDMQALGALCAASAPTEGAVICLVGDVGCGKTVFARGFVRAMSEDPSLNVCSPTFLLTQEYGPVMRQLEIDGGKGVPLVHADLYRLSAGDDLGVLGIPGVALSVSGGGEHEGEDEHPPAGFSLIEWPDVLVNNARVHLRNELEVKISRGSSADDGGGGGGADLDYWALEDAARTVSLRSKTWSLLFQQLKRLNECTA